MAKLDSHIIVCMKRLRSLVFVGALAVGAGACGGGSDDNKSSDSDTTETTTRVYDRGSDEALAAAEDVIANGMPSEYTDQYAAVKHLVPPRPGLLSKRPV